MLPRRIRLADVTAEQIAWRLVRRAHRQRLENEEVAQHWECRSQWRNVGPAILVILVCIALIAVTFPISRGMVLQDEVFAGLSLWAKLGSFAAAAFISTVFLVIPTALLIVLRHGIKDLFTGRQIVSLRTDGRGIDAIDQRGGHRRYEWRKLKRARGFCRLGFGGSSPGTITFAAKNNIAWCSHARVLQSIFLPEYAMTPAKRHRATKLLEFCMLAGLLAAYLVASTVAEDEMRWVFLGTSALIALGLAAHAFRGSRNRRLANRRRTTPRTFGYAEFS